MIFLTVGTWQKGFDRLVKAVDQLKGAGIISDEVTAQIGSGKYKPKNLRFMDFCSLKEFISLMTQARVIISHAGMGTIAQAIKQSKPVIVVPRKASLGEHFDDHQFATVKVLEAERKILVAYGTDDIALKLKEAGNFVPTTSNDNSRIVQAVDEFISQLAEKVRK